MKDSDKIEVPRAGFEAGQKPAQGGLEGGEASSGQGVERVDPGSRPVRSGSTVASVAAGVSPARSMLDRFPHPATMAAISAEVVLARTKFPGNRFLLAALTEEVGELAKAMLQRRDPDEVQREAIQVACVAIRILEEGDASFAYVSDAEAKP
jgi:hypothetical protein